MNGFNTIAITLDDDLIDLFARLTKHTGMSAPDIIRALLPAHVADLWEVDRFLARLPVNSPVRERARHLLHNFGPGSLIDDIKHLDASYKTLADTLTEGLCS